MENHADSEHLAQGIFRNEQNYQLGYRLFYDNLVKKNVAAFCPYPNYLSGDKFKN